MGYVPPYQVNSRMIQLVSQIMKQIGKISAYSELQHQPQLRRTNKIQSIYSSLAIENNALSEEQVKDIINGKLVIGPKRDILEVQNAMKAYDAIFELNPFREEDLLKCHGMMMASLIEDAGNYRTGQEGVFDGDRVIHIAPQAKLVPQLMHDLFEYLADSDENILVKSCVFHYEFEFIHPFRDGNGRMGRFWQTCLLASDERLFAFLPMESIIKERQQEYYDAIANSSREGKSNLFIEFMLESILATVHRFDPSANPQIQYPSSQVQKLLHAMQIDVPYTLYDILELVHLKSRSSLKKNYLDPAIKAGFIEMTLPNTPNSRNQRYIRK